MGTFGKFEATIDPSALGKSFTTGTHVAFIFRNQGQTGTITKQLKNSAVVRMDETSENSSLISQSNGVVIINYKELRKLNS
ncbi:hypothetical protein [Enterococcus sp. LJL120]